MASCGDTPSSPRPKRGLERVNRHLRNGRGRPGARRVVAAVGLRNRIAHESGTLLLDRVFETERDDFDDLLGFATSIATGLSAAARAAGEGGSTPCGVRARDMPCAMDAVRR
jgi:hypothetical protein